MRGDRKPGDLVHGFKVTRSDRPVLGAKRGVYVECPNCGNEFASMPSNLRHVKGCGCKQGKPVTVFPRGTQIGPYVIKSEERIRHPRSGRWYSFGRCVYCNRPRWFDPASAVKSRSCGCRSALFKRIDKMSRQMLWEMEQQPLTYVQAFSKAYWDLKNGTGPGRKRKAL